MSQLTFVFITMLLLFQSRCLCFYMQEFNYYVSEEIYYDLAKNSCKSLSSFFEGR